jgi:rhodanese-related sulfurtransferase
MIMMKFILSSLLICAALFPLDCMAGAEDVAITAEKPFAVLNDGNGLIRIDRNAIDGAHDTQSLASYRPCPPFCVSPMRVAVGVETVGELEVIEFMESNYLSGKGVIVDLRTPDAYAKGTIPGSINLPSGAFEQPGDNSELKYYLEKLGVRARGEVGTVVRALEKLGMFDGDRKTDQWDFTASRDVLLWCDDTLCEESPRTIRALVSLGYPPEKLFYYRGGMRMWQSLGLTTIVPRARSAYASK